MDELFARFAACYTELRALPRGARRALQRRLARSSELAAILPEYLRRWTTVTAQDGLVLGRCCFTAGAGTRSGTAATITVTTNNPNIAADGQCSLIEAIVNANNDAATFPDCAGGQRSGHDCAAGKRQRDAQCCIRYTYGQFGNPSVCLRLQVGSLLKVTALQLLAKETRPLSVSWPCEEAPGT